MSMIDELAEFIAESTIKNESSKTLAERLIKLGYRKPVPNEQLRERIAEKYWLRYRWSCHKSFHPFTWDKLKESAHDENVNEIHLNDCYKFANQIFSLVWPVEVKYTNDGKQLCSVNLTRKEILALPMETRRRILSNQARLQAVKDLFKG